MFYNIVFKHCFTTLLFSINRLLWFLISVDNNFNINAMLKVKDKNNKEAYVYFNNNNIMLNVCGYNSANKNYNWWKNHFPLNRFKKLLISSRNNYYYKLDMQDIETIITKIKNNDCSIRNFGRNCVQIFVYIC